MDPKKYNFYALSVQKGMFVINVPQEFQLIAAESLGDAFKIAKDKYPNEPSVNITLMAEVNVDRVMKTMGIKTEAEKEIPKLTVQDSVKKESKTKEQFVNELSLVADQFIKNKRDRTIIKNILKKIT